MRVVFQIILAAVIAVLGWMVFQQINRPMEYKKMKKVRDKAVKAKLVDIRDAEKAYLLANGKYTASFDTLQNFVKTGFIPLIKRTGTLTDDMLANGIDEKKAIKKGMIKIDTVKVSVMDSLFSKKPHFDVTKMAILPNSGKKIKLEAKELPSESGIPVPVFQASVHYDDLLEDLRNGDYNEEYRSDTMEMNRLKQYIGLKVGSLEEANDGAVSWE